MPKDIAVVAYSLDPTEPLTKDAVTISNALNANGYSAQLVHQWSFDELRADFRPQSFWEQFDGVVLGFFYGTWNLRELIRAKTPVICTNAEYVDDLGLAERLVMFVNDDEFLVVNATHPITAGAGLSVGGIDVGADIGADSVNTFNHHVDVLVTTLANQPVLVAHKTQPLVYFGWYQMAKATPGGKAFTLLLQSANWAFTKRVSPPLPTPIKSDNISFLVPLLLNGPG
jgi:hypothetical protein